MAVRATVPIKFCGFNVTKVVLLTHIQMSPSRSEIFFTGRPPKFQQITAQHRVQIQRNRFSKLMLT